MPPAVSVTDRRPLYSSLEPPLASPPSLLHGMIWLTCCAVALAFASAEWRTLIRASGVAMPKFSGRDYAFGAVIVTIGASYTGLCFTGALLVIVRKLNWIRGRVEVGAWLLFALGLTKFANFLIGQLSPTLAFSRPAIRLAALCLAWSLPLLSRRMRPDGKWLCLLILATDIMARLAVMYLPSLGPHVLGEWPSFVIYGTYWLIKWPCTVLGIATFIAREPHTSSRGWLHVAGLACVLLGDFLWIAL